MGRGHPPSAGGRQARGLAYIAVAILLRPRRPDRGDELARRPGSVRLPRRGTETVMMRLALAALVWPALALGQVCLADGVDVAGKGQAPILRFHADSADPAYGSVDLQHLGA